MLADKSILIIRNVGEGIETACLSCFGAQALTVFPKAGPFFSPPRPKFPGVPILPRLKKLKIILSQAVLFLMSFDSKPKERKL